MEIFKNCLLVSDIDGTLLENGVIPQKNIDAIDFFIKGGGKFAVSSGRSIEAVRNVQETAHCNAPSVVYNGATVYDYKNEKAVFNLTLNNDAKLVIKPIMEHFPDLGIEIHCDRNLYAVQRTVEVDEHIQYEGLTAINVKLDDIMDIDWTKAIFMTNDLSMMNEVHEFSDSLSLRGAYFLRTATIYYELTNELASKANGVKQLKNFLDKEYKVFAIGDYYNDIEMLKAADISACVEETPDEIKSICNFVAGACKDGAVADFIEYLAKLLKNDCSTLSSQ
ncbi:MAG: HAD-IIB family hydrolase [Oscillospiraceae bacterium]